MMSIASSPSDLAYRSPSFTASQMEELHIQALVYKHMLMGVPVPTELLLSVRRSFDTMDAARIYQKHHPALSLSYCSYLGKKFDAEPGRCRRTDGKKWRCAKEAYPDSKYCERHMHRGKNRSRKPVETQTTLQSQSTSDGATSIALARGTHTWRLQNVNAQMSQGDNDKDFRYPYGIKAKVGEHNPFLEASKSTRGLGTASTQGHSWDLTHSPPMASFSGSEIPNDFAMENNQYQHPASNDITRASVISLQKQDRPQTSLFGHDFVSMESVKQSQSLRPFFDEWPNTRSSWADQEESKSTNASFSTTQLSISLPMASSNFASLGCKSPNDH